MSEFPRSPSEIHVAQAALISLLTRIRTWTPATIVTYDHARKRATVQPSIRVRRPDGETHTIPPIPNRPVANLFGGGWIFTFDLDAEDEVVLACFDTNVDDWLRDGGIVNPVDARRMHLSDCIVLPIAWSASKAPRTSLPGEMVIGRDDGSTRLRLSRAGSIRVEAAVDVVVEAPTATVKASTQAVLDSPDVRLGGPGASSVVALANLTNARLDAIHAHSLGHIHPTPSGPSSPASPSVPPLPPTSAPVGATNTKAQ